MAYERIIPTKQEAARTRNWHLRQLRAFFHLCPPPVSEKVRKKIQGLVDGEIRRLGGESEIARQRKRRKEMDDYLNNDGPEPEKRVKL